MTCDETTLAILVASVNSIEQELGPSPEGVYASVRTRLDILEARINNPYAPAPSVTNPFYIGNSGVTIQDGYGDPTVTTPPAIPGSLFLREDGANNQGLYAFRPDSLWHLINTDPFTAAGDLSGTIYTQTVIGIQGNPVEAQTLGSGQTNFALVWSGTQWSAQNVFSLTEAGGDLGDFYPNPTVRAVWESKVPQAGTGVPPGYSYSGAAYTVGNVLQIINSGIGTQALGYAPLNLANNVTGVLSSANQVAQTLGGDVTGTTAASVVVALQGNAVKSGALGSTQDGYVLTWINADSEWEATPTASIFSAGGDLSGNATNQLVAKIQGTTVSNIFPITGQSLIYDINGSGEYKPQFGNGPVFNVMDFGAKGDGTTDDTAAIQACINAPTATSNSFLNRQGGGIIYFPPGNYIISSELVIPDDVPLTIRGSGMNQTNIIQQSIANGFAQHSPFEETNGLPTKIEDLSLSNAATFNLNGTWAYATRQPNTHYNVNDVVIFPGPSNRVLQCTTSGTTGNYLPFSKMWSGVPSNPSSNLLGQSVAPNITLSGTPNAWYKQIVIEIKNTGTLGAGSMTFGWVSDGSRMTGGGVTSVDTAVGVTAYTLGSTGLTANFTNPITTNITSASFGASLPQSTINVGSTVGFTVAPATVLITSSAGTFPVQYDGLTPTTLFDCDYPTGASGTLSSADTVYVGYFYGTVYSTPPYYAGGSNIVGDTIADGTCVWTVIDGGCAILQENGGYFEAERIFTSGWINGIVLDNTEVSAVHDCQFGANNCIWLVSSNERNNGDTAPTQPGDSTNVIEFKNIYLNCGGIGIADGGGINHCFEDFNFEGGGAGSPIWFGWLSGTSLCRIVNFTGEGNTNGFQIGTIAPFTGSSAGANAQLLFDRSLIQQTNTQTTTVLPTALNPITLSGVSTLDTVYVFNITIGGLTGTAEFQWSDDGGITFSSNTPTSSSVTLSTTGITAFFSGSYIMGSIYMAIGWTGRIFDAAFNVATPFENVEIKNSQLNWKGANGFNFSGYGNGLQLQNNLYEGNGQDSFLDQAPGNIFGQNRSHATLNFVQVSAGGGIGYNCIPAINGYDIIGSFALRSLPLTLSDGYNNDIANPGTASVEIIDISLPFIITGIATGTEGQIIRLVNLSPGQMTISHQDGYSSSGNRIICPNATDLVFPAVSGGFSSVTLRYSLSETAWLVDDVVGGLSGGYTSTTGDVTSSGSGAVATTVVSATGSAGNFAINCATITNQIATSQGTISNVQNVSTTNATPSTTTVYTIPSNACSRVDVTITGRSGVNAVNQTWSGKVVSNSGTPTIFKSFAPVDAMDSNGTLSGVVLSVAMSGSAVQVTVTGISSTTISWTYVTCVNSTN